MSRYVDWRNEPVEVLSLSVRSRNVLRRLQVETLGALCALTEADLLSCRNCGRRTVAELRDVLTRFGLALRDE